MHSKPLHLVIAINRKYIRYAYVMLTSLLLHTTCDVHVYILHRELARQISRLLINWHILIL